MKDFKRLGILLQGNLQCFGDKLEPAMREHFTHNEYFVLGSDTHNPQSMEVRTTDRKRRSSWRVMRR